MTDKELLELAAKAAGIADGEVLWDFDQEKVWDPLTDDGDAQRLAVKLMLDILQIRETHFVKVQDYWSRAGVSEPHGNDPYAATRRAIVRAAAEVGKGIKQSIAGDVPEDNYYKTQAEAEEVGRAAAAIGKEKE